MSRPSRKELDEMGDRIAVISAEIDAALHELLTELRAFDRAGGWHMQGALTCAHWLSWRTSLSLGPAREKVRVANKLGGLLLIGEALRGGRLSYSKVRALTRAATPDNEAELLNIAHYSTASQLEKVCRMYRSHRGGDVGNSGNPGNPETPESPEDAEAKRWVTSRGTDDNMVRITIQLPADEAAVVLEAMHNATETHDRADGIVAMAEATLAGDNARAGRSPVEVMVHVDATTLTGHTVVGDGIPAESAKRLLCDCGVVPVLEDEAGRIIDVGRKRRTVSTAVRRALAARDQGCCFPGCTNSICDAHHIRHWIENGETTLPNLLSMCRRHHRYVHEYGFSIVLDDDGAAQFFDPYGRHIPATGQLHGSWRPDAVTRAAPGESSLAVLRARHQRQGINIDVDTNYPAWNGKPVDYYRVVSSLLL